MIAAVDEAGEPAGEEAVGGLIDAMIRRGVYRPLPFVGNENVAAGAGNAVGASPVVRGTAEFAQEVAGELEDLGAEIVPGVLYLAGVVVGAAAMGGNTSANVNINLEKGGGHIPPNVR